MVSIQSSQTLRGARARRANDFSCSKLSPVKSIHTSARDHTKLNASHSKKHRRTRRLAKVPEKYLTTDEAAQMLCMSQVALGRWRVEGKGPPFHKFGRRVVYDRADVKEWAKRRKYASTSEYGVANWRQ